MGELSLCLRAQGLSVGTHIWWDLRHDPWEATIRACTGTSRRVQRKRGSSLMA